MALISTGGYDYLNEEETTTDSTDDTSTDTTTETTETTDTTQDTDYFNEPGTTGGTSTSTTSDTTDSTDVSTDNETDYSYDSGGTSDDTSTTETTDTSTSSTTDDSGGLDASLPETVDVGVSYDGVDPPGRWVNPVDCTRLHIKDSQPMQGATAPVVLEFTNRMEQSVSIDEPVTVNGQQVTTASATLAPGEEMQTTASLPVPKADHFTVRVADNSDVQETRDYLGGRNLNLAPDPPDPGAEAHLYITWVNQLSESISRQVPVKVNGNQVDTHQVDLGPNGTKDAKITVTVPAGDSYDIDAGPASVSGHTTANSAYETVTGTDSGGFTTETSVEQGTWTDDFDTAQGSTDAEQGQLVDSGDVEDGQVVSDNVDGAAPDQPESSGSISIGPFEDLFESSESGSAGTSRRKMGLAAVAVLLAAWAGGFL